VCPDSHFRRTLDDRVAIMKGELEGMCAFAGGRFKIEGDTMLGTSLNSIV
jgi:putative sterol carrier protein